jgi:hypothetical protein
MNETFLLDPKYAAFGSYLKTKSLYLPRNPDLAWIHERTFILK